MDNREARAFLSVHRAGENADDTRFVEAERQAAADAELTQWWAEDQAVDRAIGAKLMSAPAPADLRARLVSERRLDTAEGATRPPFRQWQRAALLAAAAIVALAVLFASLRGPLRSAGSLADYRDEMISFVKLTPPPLELETSDLAHIQNFLAQSGGPSQVSAAGKLRRLDPVGCRMLRFRGHNVALICFKSGGGRLAHLLVVDRAVLRGIGSSPQYAKEGEWATAAWTEGDRAYLLAIQGDETAAQNFLSNG